LPFIYVNLSVTLPYQCAVMALSCADETTPRVAYRGAVFAFGLLVSELRNSSITKDVRPRAVLDDWRDRGLVTVDAQDRVTLIETAMLPKPGEDNQLFYFGRNLHDHVAAAAANVGGGDRLFLERAVHYDGLTADAAHRLETVSRQLAMQALETANKEAQDVCAETEPGEWRWNFGLYVYLEPQGGAASEAPGQEPKSGVED
jgi:hypothetical protein